MNYTISEIKKVSEQDYNGKKRVAFKVEGNDKELSTFTEYPEAMTVGAEIFGDIVAKEKDGKTYWNFISKKKEEKDDLSELYRLINQQQTTLGKLEHYIKAIYDHHTGERPLGVMSDGNPVPDFHQVDDIWPTDEPRA